MLLVGHCTHPGPRAGNQDSVRTDGGRGYAIVADGMGGPPGGADASRLAVELSEDLLRKALPEALRSGAVEGLLRRIVHEANHSIHGKIEEAPELRGMGTTLVILVLGEGSFTVAHVGDSRAYRISGGTLTQLTRDHSYVQAQVDAGLLTPEDAARSYYRNLITRAVGTEESVEADLTAGTLLPGDTFVLTTDGVHGVVPARSLLAIAGREEPARAAEALVEEALALRTKDNATAAVLRWGATA
jgi:PPM family protein phosphatase